MNQVVILRNDLGTRSREVEGVRLFGSTQVMQFENEVFREKTFIPPNDPAHTSID